MSGYYWTLRATTGKGYNPDQPRVPKGDPRGGQWTSAGGSTLKTDLEELRSKIAAAAQAVLDDYSEEEYGGGGICDRVAEEMSGAIWDELDVGIYEGGQPGDDHAWLIVYSKDRTQAFGVDIPPEVYESGGGYSWTVHTDRVIGPDDVVIWEIDTNNLDFYLPGEEEGWTGGWL